MPRPRNPENTDLPPGWRLSRNAYYYQIPKHQQHLWGGKKQVLLGKTIEEAKMTLELTQSNTDPCLTVRHANDVNSRIVKANQWKQLHQYDASCGIPLTFLQALYTSSRCGAEQRGLSYSLSPADLVRLAMLANGRCMLSGIAWDYKTKGVRGKRPWAPSLDRIDSTEGYSFENCRLVGVAVNIALSDFGHEILFKIAVGISNNRNLNSGINLNSTVLAE